MKRIVKEILKNGKVQYRVEKNTKFFGLIPCKWHTCTVTFSCDFGDITCESIFNTLEEAQEFYGINNNPVIEREVLTE